MAGIGGKWKVLRSVSMILWSFALASMFVSAERSLKQEASTNSIHNAADESGTNYLLKVANFFWQSNQSGYQHVWPVSLIIVFFPPHLQHICGSLFPVFYFVFVCSIGLRI